MTVPRDPVVIVGAGPVGVACALMLAGRGVATVVLERHQTVYRLPRGVHLDDEVFRILQAVSVDEKFAKVSRPMPGMRLIDGRRRVMTEFTRSTEDGRTGFPPDSMFDQPDLERILLDAAATAELVDLRRGCEVTEVIGGTHGLASAGGAPLIAASAAVAYGEALWSSPVRAGKAAGIEAFDASSLTDAAMTWNSRSWSTLVLNGIDHPSTDSAPYCLPPFSTAGGAAKANWSYSLVFFCCTRSFIRPENMMPMAAVPL